MNSKMQRCKYLDDLGLKIEEYSTNFTLADDRRNEQWSREREIYGFDSRETWCLDYIFIEWIYTRVKMYKERCNVNLDYNKISYKNKEITQGEAIDLMLALSEEILLKKDKDMTTINNSKEICEIWKEVLPYMWW